jgi:AcrR family transcriptional regulator
MTGVQSRPAPAKAGAEEAPRARTRKVVSWKKDPHGRRERVLAEATRLFSERGYAAVSTADIAAAAGVAEGNVFHYFGSKPDLLKAVGERYGSAFASAMFDRIEPVVSKQTIEGLVSRAFDFVAESWPGFGLFLLSDDPSAAPLAQKANRAAITRSVLQALESWSSQHIVAEIDAPVVAELLFGLMEASLRACFAGDRGERHSPARVAAADQQSGNAVDRPSRARFETQTVLAISRILGIPVEG